MSRFILSLEASDHARPPKKSNSSPIDFTKKYHKYNQSYFSGNYTLGSPGGHSTTGLFVNSGLPNGHGPNGHHHNTSNGPISFLNGGTSLANLGLMTNSHLPPNIQNQSPTSVLSNYSLNRNLNQLNLNLVPRNNR